MTGYWESRRNFGYYVLVKAWLDAISAHSIPSVIGASLVAPEPTERLSLLDVGPLDTPVATWGHFSERYTVDIAHDPQLPGVRSFVEDFLTWQMPSHWNGWRLTAVTCLQVLEHLPDDLVHEFGAKLRAISRYTIVSVPFMWPKDAEPEHKQDPIDLLKLSQIMGDFPTEYAIVLDTKRLRLVARWNNLP